MWTSAPPARRRSTVAAPMPLAPPVTSATRPWKSKWLAMKAFLYGHGVRYPLGTERRDEVRTPGGLSLDELDLHGGRVSRAELRATPETLRLQAEVAEGAGRRELGANLRRAAELAAVSEDLVLDVYTALRPRRSSADELESWAVRLEEIGAPLNAAFVREARDVYATRGLLG
jgi:propanediol dehydratase small subunit